MNYDLKTQNSIWRRWRHGFTLIELLVVITIIGILVTIAIASFQTAQAKARDSRRKTNLDAHKKALELYKSDTSSGAYPACAGAAPAGPCKITINADFSQTGGDGTPPVGTDLTTTPYFGTPFPVDPKNSGGCTGATSAANKYAGNVGYAICYWPQVPALDSGSDTQYSGYILTVCLENSNDAGDNTYTNGPADCDGDVNHDRTYGFSNP